MTDANTKQRPGPEATERVGVYQVPRLRTIPAPNLWSATAYALVFTVLIVLAVRLAAWGLGLFGNSKRRLDRIRR